MITLQPREDEDLSRCASLLREVHATDDYPVNMPEDPASFFALSDAIGAWVAVAEGDVAGHVLLRSATDPKVMTVASDATGLPRERLAVVARLLVSPSARRRGIGRALLAHAASEAWKLDRRPVLDVVTEHVAAVALYEREGWRIAGHAHVSWPTGRSADELVFVGPDCAQPGGGLG